MQEDLNTLEGCQAFLRRIREEAIATGKIALRPFEFVRAVELGAVEYAAAAVGVSIAGAYIGECVPQVLGAVVEVVGEC